MDGSTTLKSPDDNKMIQKVLLTPKECFLHVIDPQQRLMEQVVESERVSAVIALMFNVAQLLKMPVIANTQYEKGLGPYVEELESLMAGVEKFDKVHFCCCADAGTAGAVNSLPDTVNTVLLSGVETHICVYQTAKWYLDRGFNAWIVADAVSSRTFANYEFGLRRLEQMGCIVGPAEMIIYELLAKAGTKEFTAVLPYVLGDI